jgi:flagellar biosynthetic protein FlhB
VSDETEQNRSEHPTQHKLSRARRKGSVARGADLGFVTSLAAFAGYYWVMGGSLTEQVGRAAQSALVAAPNLLDSPNAIMAVTGAVLAFVFKPLAFMAAAVFLVVLVFEVVQTGLVFSTEPLSLDFSRLSPAKGLKRLFTVRILIETVKNIVKLMVYVAIAWMVIRHALEVDIPSVTTAQALGAAMSRAGFRLLVFFLAAGVFFAAVDQLIVRRDFLKKMRMSRREIRRESRDREGEPRMKQKRKQLHAEFVKQSQGLRNIRDADVLITNPIHYAVALRYDGRTMFAPTIISQGAHQFAQRLKRLAFVYGVVVVQDPKLARALYRCEINREIPDAHYRRVAEIYLNMRDVKEGRDAQSNG